MRKLYRQILIVLVCGLAVLSPELASAKTNSPLAKDSLAAIDAYVRGEMRAASIPGLAFGIVKDGAVVHLAAFGSAGSSGQAMTPQTPTNIGSVGKTITALAIRQLINAGKIDIEAPVQQYVPWFRTADPEASARITVRNLLEHKSGFATADGQAVAMFRDGPSNEDLGRGLASVSLDRPVGSTFEYSNLNYLMLGLVVQYASGQPYEDYVRQKIFAPLGMRHSYFSVDEARQNGLADGHRLIFGLPIPAVEPFPGGLAATGYHFSCAEDMAYYLAAFANHGRYQDISIVSPDGKSAGADLDYGIDWDPLQSIPEGFTPGHSGANLTYTSGLLFIPAEHLGVVVLANVNPSQAVPIAKNAFTIALDVLRMALGAPRTTPAPAASHIYLVIDGILLLAAAGALISAFRLRSWKTRAAARRRTGLYTRAVLLNGLLPVLIFILFPLPTALETSPVRGWERLFASVPDIAYSLFIISAILLLVGTVKLVWVTTKKV